MDNPYWASDGQEHYVNLATVRLLCFELTNIFEASKNLSEGVALSASLDEVPAKMENHPLVELHQELAFKKTSELLLQLAMLVRAYDDQMKDSAEKVKYEEHAEENDSGNCIGRLEGKEVFNLREGCNKIIHAREVRPLYERVDQYHIESDNDDMGQDVWYLTGEIELYGTKGKKKWKALLYLQPYLETVLGQIKYGLPDQGSS